MNTTRRAGLALAVAGILAAGGVLRAEPPAAPAGSIAAQAAQLLDPHSNISEDSARTGEAVYRRACAACHDTPATRAPQRASLGLFAPRQVLNTITDGKMKVMAGGLSPSEKVAVSEFLTQRRVDAADAVDAAPRCQGRAARFDPADVPRLAGWGLDAANTHYIPAAIADLDRGNVGRLKLKWAMAFPGVISAASQPAIGGGAIYVGGFDGKVYALDRETGCARWTFDAGAPVRTGIVLESWSSRAKRIAPRLYFGDQRGHAFALDAMTGKLIWRQQVDTNPSALVTGTPALSGGALYVPVSSIEEASAADPGYACCTFRGSLVALDAATGRLRWRTWMTPPPVSQGKRAGGVERFGPSGAALWSSPLVDPRRRRVYVTSGDNYSDPATGLSDAVIALDMATGKVAWANQTLAGDAFTIACMTAPEACPKANGPDLDFGTGAMLARDGQGRELLLAGQKSGTVFALDPANGKLVWRRPVGRGGVLGGVHFGMATAGGKVFVPINDGEDGVAHDTPARPGVYALDLATGAFAWKAPASDTCGGRAFCRIGYSAAITAAGPLVLAGSSDGHLRVFGASDGVVLHDIDTTVAVRTVNGTTAHGGSMSGGGAPIAWQGKLIVNSGYGALGKMPGNVLLVYDVN